MQRIPTIALLVALLTAVAGAVPPIAAQQLALGQEFVLFVDSLNASIPENEGVVVSDPDNAGNPVLRLDYSNWASKALAFDEAIGADMSAMTGADPTTTQSLYLRLRVDSELAGRGVCNDDGSNCLSLSLFDSFSGPQDRQAIHTGAGDAAMRLKWFIPDSLRDGAWHTLRLPLPPATLAQLENARDAGQLASGQEGWHYTGAWAGGYGIGCCGSLYPTEQDSLWREFDWARVARVGVHFDFSDAGAGSVYLDDFYIGDDYTDVSGLGTPAVVPAMPLAPSDASEDMPATVTLQWTGRRGARHDIQVSRDPFFNVVDRSETVVEDSLRVESLAAYATYHWRVRAHGRGGPTSWTAPWSFTVGGISAPILTWPAADATGISTSPSLTWSEVAGAISYRIQVSESNGFTDTVFDEAGIPGNSTPVSNLSHGTTYWWRVRAESVQGPGDWATAIQFETIAQPPDAPALSLPADGALDQPETLMLSWQTGLRASTYRIQVATEPEFLAPLVNAEISATSHQVTDLSRGTTYHWRIRSINSGGMSEWVTRSFQTEMDPPPASMPVSPSDGSVDTYLSTTLRWQAVAAAELYRIQVSHTVSFDPVALDTVQVGRDSIQVTGLRSYRVHFWRVKASNRGGESDWSPVFTFRTIMNVPPVARPDDVAALEDVTLDIHPLINDTDADGDALGIIGMSQPAHGYVHAPTSGTLRYTPPAEWAGVDSLAYTVSDGKGGTAEARVKITVHPVNDAPGIPEIMLPLPGTTLHIQGDPQRLFRVLWNPVTDVEGDSVRYRWELSAEAGFASRLLTEETGTQTTASVPYGRIAEALTSAGLGVSQPGVVYHRVVATDGQATTGGAVVALPVIRGTMTSVEGQDELPGELALEGVYPNPASGDVSITVALPESAAIRIGVIDALGRLRHTEHTAGVAGRAKLTLDASGLSSGLYMIVLEVNGRRLSTPLMVAR